jgi:hypothetical protein
MITISEPEVSSADFSIHFGGSVSLFHPLTDAARSWLAEHCPEDGEHQYWAGALCIEHRFTGSLRELAIKDGLVPAN